MTVGDDGQRLLAEIGRAAEHAREWIDDAWEGAEVEKVVLIVLANDGRFDYATTIVPNDLDEQQRQRLAVRLREMANELEDGLELPEDEENRTILNQACAAHGWELRVMARDQVTGEHAQAHVRIKGVDLTANGADEEFACAAALQALVAVGGLDVLVDGVPSKHVYVRVYDPATGRVERSELPDDSYILLTGSRMACTYEQHFGNGTTQLTIKPIPSDAGIRSRHV